MKAAAEASQRVDVRLYGAPAEVLQQVIMDVKSVQTCLAGVNLVEIREVIVDEVWEWLRWVHAR